jgi:hypothetical protein
MTKEEQKQVVSNALHDSIFELQDFLEQAENKLQINLFRLIQLIDKTKEHYVTYLQIDPGHTIIEEE